MELKEFYRTVDRVVLFPGSVDDLNRILGKGDVDAKYQLMNVPGGRKYLTGMIIQSEAELRESASLKFSGFSSLKEGLAAAGMAGLEDLDSQMREMSCLLDNLTGQILRNPALLDSDIRLRAKRLGANGLVHIQMYDKDGVYMGVPVKIGR